LTALNREVVRAWMILNQFQVYDDIYSYDSLGVYKLFLDPSVLEHINELISPDYLKMKKEDPELTETMEVYIECNQSLKLTSEKLFLHSKTVKYRLDKIQKLYKIDFSDPDFVYRVMTNRRLFRLLDHIK
jgi:purine catabolism regulator